MTMHEADRRTSARMPAVANRSRMEWDCCSHDGEPGATLLDISRGGALLEVEVEAAPPMDQDVWFRIDSPAESPWVQGRVIRREGRRRAALAFDRPCPADVMLAATLGIALDFGLTACP